MFRVLIAFAALLALAPAASAQTPMTADAIIARHIEARGGVAALQAIHSLVFRHGAYSENGEAEGDAGATMMLMRPYYKVVGDPGAHPDFLEGFDGSSWEYYGDPGVVLRTTGAASGAARHAADIDSPLANYREMGAQVGLSGTVSVGNRRAYQLHVTMMDGYEEDEFIDTRTFMLIASRRTAKVHAFGADVTSEQRFDDFRRVGGVLFPFRSREVEIATGRELNAMQWGSIEANVDLPVSYFSPPSFERTPVQAFIEQLYYERTDADALLWTYRIFRRAHPDVNTDEACQIAGYQILKMGQVAQAIALLERNAADNPSSADAAFTLGRAYATAERYGDARTQFQTALRLQPGHPRATRGLAGLPAQ